MDPEHGLAVIGLIWLIVSVLLMALSIRRGRELADALVSRHPETYKALGRPRPGFFENVRRTRFARFVGRREYEHIGDDALAAHFEDYRKSEARLLMSILASGGLIALLVFAVRNLS
jgi:uncharacterized membrane protein YhfC